MSGISSVVGLGIPGTSQGGVMTVQGDPAGTPIPVTVSGGGGAPTEVEGTAANGAAPVGNPVWMGGYDGAAIRALLLDTSGRTIVVGATATGAAVATNPVTIGGADDSSNVQRINVDSTGALRTQSGGAPGSAAPTRATQVGGTDGTNLRANRMAQFNADASTLDGGYAQTVNTIQSGYNGATSDRWRNNLVATLLASAARTATTDAPDQTNYNGRGVHVVLSVTVASGTGGLLVLLQGKDPVSGNYYQMNTTPTAVTALATLGYELYPGSSGTAVAAGLVQRIAGSLPRTWRVRVQHGDASSYTYSVAAVVIV